jgi:hypothetical protein
VAGVQYGVVVERPIDRVALDLDQADAQLQRRWFVWTAAGLTVHPVTWTDDNAGRPAPLVRRSEVARPRSLGLRVSRPNAHADIVVYADGWADMAVRRPDADGVAHETAQLESVDAFGALLDRVVELITWSGVGTDHGRSAPDLRPRPQRAAHWVLGFDGLPPPIEP